MQSSPVANHAHIAEALGVRQSHLLLLFDRQPTLLRAPARQLIPRMQRLAQVLAVPMEQVRLCGGPSLPRDTS